MARAGSEAIGERDDAVAELAATFDDERPVEHGGDGAAESAPDVGILPSECTRPMIGAS